MQDAFTLWSLVPHGGLNCSDKKNISHVRSIRKKGWSIGYTKPSLASGNNSLVSVSVIDFKWKGAANDSRIYAYIRMRILTTTSTSSLLLLLVVIIH